VRCPPNTAELWRINLSTPQDFSPSYYFKRD
jgi:hypothetical protein